MPPELFFFLKHPCLVQPQGYSHTPRGNRKYLEDSELPCSSVSVRRNCSRQNRARVALCNSIWLPPSFTWATSSIFAPHANRPNGGELSKKPPATGWPMAVQKVNGRCRERRATKPGRISSSAGSKGETGK